MTKPKTLLEKFEHNCEIGESANYQTDQQNDGKPPNLVTRIKRSIMIDEVNCRTYKLLRSMKKIEDERAKQLVHPKVIHPFSAFRTNWELFMAIIIMTQLITVPLDVALHNLYFARYILVHWSYIAVRCLTTLISLVDIFINFTTGYWKEKDAVVILEPSKIFWYYFTHKLIIDAFCTVPWDFVFAMFHTYLTRKEMFIFRYLQLLKCYRFRFVITYWCNFCEAKDVNTGVYKSLIMLAAFIVYIHLICCCCITFTSYELDWQPELVRHSVIVKGFGSNVTNFATCYGRFLYTSLMLVLNSGNYEDSTMSVIGSFFCTITWIVSKTLYYLTIAYFMASLSAFESSRELYMEILSEIKLYMRHRQVPVFLQKRILAYYEIKYQNCYYNEKEIIATVSAQLQQEISMNSCKMLLKKVTFLKDLPMPLTVRIVACLRYEVFLTNDVIIKAGTVGACMYFIASGTVTMYKKCGREVKHLQDGDFFGEITLVYSGLRPCNVIAADVCELYRLDQNDFIKCVTPYPELINIVRLAAQEKMDLLDAPVDMTSMKVA